MKAAKQEKIHKQIEEEEKKNQDFKEDELKKREH
eukprot:CAMPEP_0170549348 /NCGR_PEP_ID=MMETSP0211-20121228/7504_1 /TAXON_ID=311385 /ORGANISM="Pseudokeronopsis sp., Strain OXSARD2" /LENGTH=33 /DNA_ID= /DNA_START= /DNA_END= /DNA_ORIENTATION=